ncbi:MAG: PAS domain-containing protein [Verrucomicrobiae bacterium]|nr:PAS domain-containing protein [Verrucomicrobiae bacterium]
MNPNRSIARTQAPPPARSHRPHRNAARLTLHVRVAETARLERANRLLRVLLDTQKQVPIASSPDSFLRETCRLLVASGVFRLASIATLHPTGSPSLQPVAHAGFLASPPEPSPPQPVPVPQPPHPLALALARNLPHAVPDLAPLRFLPPWNSLPFPAPPSPATLVPLAADARPPFALLCLAHTSPDPLDPDTLALLTELARDVVAGADTIRRDLARSHAVAELHASEERLRLALWAANQGLFDLNLKTGEAIVTPEYATMLGYDPADFRETNDRWLQRLHPDDRESVRATFLDYLAGRIPTYQVEFRQRTRSGDWKWILSLGKLVERDAEGRPLRMLGTHTDISARKQTEAALHAADQALRASEERFRHLNAELEERVGQRTAQLEAALAELDAFAYSISHDLRAPLRAIVGYAGILAEDHGPQLDPKAASLLDVVRNEARRLGQMVDDLLRFSRLGRQPLTRIAVDMNPLVQAALRELAPHLATRQVALQLSQLPGAVGDPSLLRHVWINLLDNALKFSRHQPRAEIHVSGFIRDGFATYSVRDNGAGFPMAHAHKLFNVFQRLHAADEFEGTGVGLALVHRIVQRHGGRIWAEAQPDHGALFHFSLPTHPPDATA